MDLNGFVKNATGVKGTDSFNAIYLLEEVKEGVKVSYAQGTNDVRDEKAIVKTHTYSRNDVRKFMICKDWIRLQN
jgi:hypothetical protein